MKFYLRFGQIELPGELGAFPANHVLAPLELKLQSVQLLCRERGTRALGPVQVEAFRQHNLPYGAFGVCIDKTQQQNTKKKCLKMWIQKMRRPCVQLELELKRWIRCGNKISLTGRINKHFSDWQLMGLPSASLM